MTETVAAAHLVPAAPTFPVDVSNVESGMMVEALTSFVESSGIPLQSLYQVVIPARTLKHRRARHETLSVEESDKLARVVRMYDLAVRVLGDADKALRWLTRPRRRFAERTPLSMLRTEVGGRYVEELLGQIDEGMFA